jgi:glycosyltransferase involved in cell wall biosynthesis
MKFSIIVPTYNEQADIPGTLDALVALDYEDKEIIVVDDSTDSTPGIVARYSDNGVRLIHPNKRAGRCEARNIGIIEAKGEVVVILNADVRPKEDFLKRLLPHYETGYDYVLVHDKVGNSDALLARYVGAMANIWQEGDPSWMEWTEGFSCRRHVAIKAGLFPTGFAVPICAGEDGYFGIGLRSIGARKKIDLTITVEHVAPATIKEFWQIRKGRGKGSPQVRRFLHSWSMGKIVGWAFLRIVKTAVMVVSVFPVLIVSWRKTRYSRYKGRDLFPFMLAWFLEQMAFHVGEWNSIFEIMKAEKAEKLAGHVAYR